MINGRFESPWFSFIFFLAAGIGGLWWVLSADRPSPALTLASFLGPPAVFYSVTNVLIGGPGTEESSDPFIPCLVVSGAFRFAVAAMLVPLLSEFDVALGARPEDESRVHETRNRYAPQWFEVRRVSGVVFDERTWLQDPPTSFS